jgi:hypothetical protein
MKGQHETPRRVAVGLVRPDAYPGACPGKPRYTRPFSHRAITPQAYAERRPLTTAQAG